MVIVCPFEKRIKFGAANPGHAIGGTKNDAGGHVADNDDTGLVTCRHFEAMTGQAGTEVVAIGTRRPCKANMLAGLSQIDAITFPGLMSLDAICRNRLRPIAQGASQTVGKIAMAFASKGGQDGDVVSAGVDGMAESKLEQPRDFFMSGVAEAARQDLTSHRVGLGDDEMPVTVCHTCNSTGLLVFDHQRQIRIEAEFLAQRLCSPLELLAVYGHLGGDDEMAQGVHPVKLSRVSHGVMQVRNGATDDSD
ncbi:hypothetical protein [Devosia sp. MC521]|uniref:hypothetical protein n=1 Tax=Devosia sp. MC521 TaxID=2759954 RepID=UPI0015FCA77E|nr:hypothetical protein [Devosia sp. MC521]MBJ6987272.1 hypothetical protein [Devosia sp. MC521]QMW62880.1 hypothetical protein H4N61_00465 [Devosia sp. MC521]